MTADVVIPTWRASDLLRRCLFALRADHSSKRVIVVDNASVDGTAALVRGEFPEVTLVELPDNVGFGRAVNAGARVGEGEAVVLVNNDVLVAPGVVDAIVAPANPWEEQFGMLLVEAMAAHVPVLAAASGAIPEVVGESGTLFAPGDWVGLADALAAGPLAGAPGARRAPEPARLERFSAPAAAARLRAVYEELAPV